MNQEFLCRLHEHLLILFDIIGVIRTHQRERLDPLFFIPRLGIFDDIPDFLPGMDGDSDILQLLGGKGGKTIHFVGIGLPGNPLSHGQILSLRLSFLKDQTVFEENIQNSRDLAIDNPPHLPSPPEPRSFASGLRGSGGADRFAGTITPLP